MTNKEDDADLLGLNSAPVHEPPAAMNQQKPWIGSLSQYSDWYQESVTDPHAFWGNWAQLLTWNRPFETVLAGGFETGDVRWFPEGELNVSYNCIDRHAKKTPEKVALIWEADEPGHAKHITYRQLLQEVCRLSNVLISMGVRKGDTVALYMPMIPEAVYAMLACARIGAVHSAVFAGFSAEALRDRINDAQCRVLLTADQGKRGGKVVHLKKIADDALLDCPCVEHVLLFRRTGDLDVRRHDTRDRWWHEEMAKQRPYCPPTPMNAEDPLFMLYTSGSTGKPKGVLHTQAGYLLGTMLTMRFAFDYHAERGDVWGCVADVGWITGHSYIVYGPLANGGTTLIFESVPTYPNASRYWQTVEQHKITHFYTAPTAIRALKRLGDQWVTPYKMESLRVLGTVGEPINPEAWNWYHKVVGGERCAVVDTYWQTETGSFLIAPYASVTPTKAGSATLPQFGIKIELLDPESGRLLSGPNQTGVVAISQPWPSMARTVYNNHERYLDTYFRPYPGYYFTGDGATRDAQGYIWIRGRVDDVINVSGHRMSTAEVESALVMHPACSEAAVIGVNDDVTGQAVWAFCTVKAGVTTATPDLQQELKQQVRRVIGPFAQPKCVLCVPDLPKTRSGKIMRRILRKIASNEIDSLGDVSTLADPSILDTLIQTVKSHSAKK